MTLFDPSSLYVIADQSETILSAKYCGFDWFPCILLLSPLPSEWDEMNSFHDDDDNDDDDDDDDDDRSQKAFYVYQHLQHLIYLTIKNIPEYHRIYKSNVGIYGFD